MNEIHTDMDAVEDSKAPLISHLIELRQRLIWAIVGITIGFVICFYFADEIFFVLLHPAATAAGGYSELQMIMTSPPEYFFTQLKIGLFGAMFLAFPVIASQVYMFVAPGLYKTERKSFHPLSDCYAGAVCSGGGTGLFLYHAPGDEILSCCWRKMVQRTR